MASWKVDLEKEFLGYALSSQHACNNETAEVYVAVVVVVVVVCVWILLQDMVAGKTLCCGAASTKFMVSFSPFFFSFSDLD